MYTLNSHKCVEVVFPGMKSVAVVSLVYKVQYTNVETGTVIMRQGFRTLYVHYGDFMLQRRGRWSKPKCGLSLKEVAQPPWWAPAPWGRRRGEPGGELVRARRPTAGPRSRPGEARAAWPPPSGLPTPTPARPLWEARVKLQPPCASSTSRRRPPSPTGGEVSPRVRRSLLLTGCQAGFSITAFSVSLPVRLYLPQELGIVEISSMDFEFCCLGGLLGEVDSVMVESF